MLKKTLITILLFTIICSTLPITSIPLIVSADDSEILELFNNTSNYLQLQQLAEMYADTVFASQTVRDIYDALTVSAKRTVWERLKTKNFTDIKQLQYAIYNEVYSVHQTETTPSNSGSSGGSSGGTSIFNSEWQFVEIYANGLLPQLNVAYYDVCYGNGLFVCVGRTYDESIYQDVPAVAVSENGYTWSVHRVDELLSAMAIEFDGARFVAYSHYGNSSYQPIYATSTDGVNWESYTTPGEVYGVSLGQSVAIKDDIAYVSISKFPSYGNFDAATIYKQNGDEWTEVYSLPECYIEDLKCIEGELFAVGTNGFVATSLDGENWSKVTSVSTEKTLRSVAKIDGQIVVFGTDADYLCEDLTLMRYPDGEWELWDVNTELYQGVITITPYGLLRHNFNGLAQFATGYGFEWTTLSEGIDVRAFATDGNIIVEMTETGLYTGMRKNEFSTHTFLTDESGAVISGIADPDTAILSSFVFNPDNLQCTVIAAMYDTNGRLISMQTRKKEDWEQNFDAVFRFENFNRFYKIKALFWDEASSMQPLSIPYAYRGLDIKETFSRLPSYYTFVFEANSNNGMFNNQPAVFENAPILADGEILVPDYHEIKALGGRGGSIDWRNEKMTWKINGQNLTFTAGSNYVKTDDGDALLSAPVQILDGYKYGMPIREFYIPLMDIALILDCPFEHVGNKLYTKPSWDIGVNDIGFIAVSEMCRLGIIAGYEDKTFRPDGFVLRSEFCAYVSRLIEPNSPNIYFDASDVQKNHWAYPFIGYCVNSQYIDLENGEFRPNENITGLEAVRAMVLVISQSEQGDIMLHAEQLGLLDGIENFEPTEPLTRLHFAQLIYNAYLRLSQATVPIPKSQPIPSDLNG